MTSSNSVPAPPACITCFLPHLRNQNPNQSVSLYQGSGLTAGWRSCLTREHHLHQVALVDVLRWGQTLQDVVWGLVVTEEQDLVVHPEKSTLRELRREKIRPERETNTNLPAGSETTFSIYQHRHDKKMLTSSKKHVFMPLHLYLLSMSHAHMTTHLTSCKYHDNFAF